MDPQAWIGLAVVYWLVTAFTGGYISAQKRRSPWEGIFFGLIFGPVGLIVAACMPGGSVPGEDAGPMKIRRP